MNSYYIINPKYELISLPAASEALSLFSWWRVLCWCTFTTSTILPTWTSGRNVPYHKESRSHHAVNPGQTLGLDQALAHLPHLLLVNCHLPLCIYTSSFSTNLCKVLPFECVFLGGVFAVCYFWALLAVCPVPILSPASSHSPALSTLYYVS